MKWLAVIFIGFALIAPAAAQDQTVRRFERAVVKVQQAAVDYEKTRKIYGPDRPQTKDAKAKFDRAVNTAKVHRRAMRKKYTHRVLLHKRATKARDAVLGSQSLDKARIMATLDRGLRELAGVDEIKYQKAKDTIDQIELALKAFKPESASKDFVVNQMKKIEATDFAPLLLFADEAILTPLVAEWEKLTAAERANVTGVIDKMLKVVKAYKISQGKDGAGGALDMIDVMETLAGMVPNNGAFAVTSYLKAEALMVKEIFKSVKIWDETTQGANIDKLVFLATHTGEEIPGNHWGLVRRDDHSMFTHVPPRYRLTSSRKAFKPGDKMTFSWETDFLDVAKSQLVLTRGGRIIEAPYLKGESLSHKGAGQQSITAPKVPGAYEVYISRGKTRVAMMKVTVEGSDAELKLYKTQFKPGDQVYVEYRIAAKNWTPRDARILIVKSSESHRALNKPMNRMAQFVVPKSGGAFTSAPSAILMPAPNVDGKYDVRLYLDGNEMISRSFTVKTPGTEKEEKFEIDTNVDMQQAPVTWLVHAGNNYTFKMTMRVFGAHLSGSLDGLNNSDEVTKLLGKAHHNSLEFKRINKDGAFQVYKGQAYRTTNGWRLSGTFKWQGGTYKWCAREMIKLPKGKSWDGNCDLQKTKKD